MFLNSNEVKITKINQEGNKGTFQFDFLPMGFGHTLGSSLRRVLLTSLKGAAATVLKIKGINHKFSSVPGVKEDVIQLTLNLKELRVKINGNEDVTLSVSKKGGVVTGADFKVSGDAVIVNPELVIATLADDKSVFEAEVIVSPGVGYSPSEERETDVIGSMLLDAVYSPVKTVYYNVEPSRKGNIIGLDKLILTVDTDGTVDAYEAIKEAATLMRDFYSTFANAQPAVAIAQEKPVKTVATSSTTTTEDSEDIVSLEDLNLPTRTINALKKSGIETLQQLSSLNDEQLADIKNLGDKSLEEIKKLLKKEGLK